MVTHHVQGDVVNRATMLRLADACGLTAASLRDVLFDLPHSSGSDRRRAEPSPLSPRESAVLTLLAQGKVYKVIAAELDLSASTVRTHLHNTYAKLDVNDRAHAVLKATELGWISVPDPPLLGGGPSNTGIEALELAECLGLGAFGVRRSAECRNQEEMVLVSASAVAQPDRIDAPMLDDMTVTSRKRIGALCAAAVSAAMIGAGAMIALTGALGANTCPLSQMSSTSQPACWRPFSAGLFNGGPFNYQLSSNPALAPNSAAVVSHMTANNWSFGYPGYHGFALGYDGSRPVFFAESSDPTMNIVCSTRSGRVRARAPTGFRSAVRRSTSPPACSPKTAPTRT